MPLARFCVVLLVLLLLFAPPQAKAQDDAPESLRPVLKAWQGALERQDYHAYVSYLHSSAREIPEYASRAAMAFWADEFRDLRDRGFSGQYHFESVASDSALLPWGTVRAHPLVNDQSLGEAIMLLREADQWTILAILGPSSMDR